MGELEQQAAWASAAAPGTVKASSQPPRCAGAPSAVRVRSPPTAPSLLVELAAAASWGDLVGPGQAASRAGLALTGFVGSGGAGGADGGRLPSLLLPPAEELVCGEGSLSRKGLERRQVAAVLLRRGGDLVSSSEEWQLL